MCKIIALKINNSAVNKIDLIKKSIDLVVTSEKSGYGVTILADEVYYYKSTNIKRAFLSNSPIFCKQDHETNIKNFSAIDKKIKFILVHGRTSTNEISIGATHPIIYNDNYFSHNGVITSKDIFTDLKTKNDSELLLRSFLKHDNLESFNNNISGYAAFFNVKKNSVELYKDSTASLFYSSNSDLEIFSTASNHCEALTSTASSELLNNVYMKNILINYDYELHSGLETNYYSDSLKHLSLGQSDENNFSQYGDLYDLFFEEVYSCVDKSYTIFNNMGYEIDYKLFLELTENEMLDCTIVRPDGTVLSPYNKELSLYDKVE